MREQGIVKGEGTHRGNLFVRQIQENFTDCQCTSKMIREPQKNDSQHLVDIFQVVMASILCISAGLTRIWHFNFQLTCNSGSLL